MSGDIKPNAKEKRWLQAVSAHAIKHGPVIHIEPGFQIHHVVGRTYIQNKVPIGHWFILPLPISLHDRSCESNSCHVGNDRRAFTERYGPQRVLFQCMVDIIEAEGWTIPPDEVLKAIATTRH